MWTINDVLESDMLYGWITYECWSCPYCLGETKAFWLLNGKKNSQFDCRWLFMPKKHISQRNVKVFKKKIIVLDDPLM